MVNSNSTENKKRVREELKNFVKKHYSSQQIKNLKVLTLISDKPYELEQIWDKLGVPRANITTVERNSEVREAIKRNHFGVNVVDNYSSIDDYISDTTQKFDIINLDYCGLLNEEQITTLSQISNKKMLREKGIVATWFSGRRESEEIQDFLRSRYDHIIELAAEAHKKKDYLMQPDEERLLKIVNGGKYLSKEELERSDSITSTLIALLSMPASTHERMTGIHDFHPIITLLGKEKKFVTELENTDFYKEFIKQNLLPYASNEKKLGDICGERLARHYLNIRRKVAAREQIDFKDRLEIARGFLGSFVGNEIVKDIVENDIKHELNNNRILYDVNNPIFLSNIAHVLLHQDSNYLLNDNVRFFYHGDNSTPMYSDFLLMEKNKFKDFFWYEKNGKLRYNLGTLKNFGIREMSRLQDHLELMLKSNVLFMESRKDMDIDEELEYSKNGSVTDTINRPILLAEDIDKNMISTGIKTPKEKIYSLLKEGKTTEEINALHPEYSKKTIGSYKAWMTMNSNKEIKNIPLTIKNKESDNIDTIIEEQSEITSQNRSKQSNPLTKSDAIMLLNDGYSPLEIVNTFPGTDIWQLRGYKANITRKQNQENTYTN